MKKHNIGEKVLFGMVLAGCLIFNCNDVNADDNDKLVNNENTIYEDHFMLKDDVKIDCSNATDVEKCKKNALKCVNNYLRPFNDNIKFADMNNDGNISVTYNGKNLEDNGTKKVNGVDVNYRISSENENSSSDTKKRIIKLYSNYVYETEGEKYPCSGTQEYSVTKYEPQFAKELHDNPSLKSDGICYKYLHDINTGVKYLDSNKYSTLNKDGTFKDNYMLAYVKYCYQDQVEENYSDSLIINKIKNAITMYNYDKDYNESSGPIGKLQIPANAKKIEKGTNVSLTCDAFDPVTKLPGVNRDDNFEKVSREIEYYNKDKVKSSKTIDIYSNKRVFYKEETKSVYVQYKKNNILQPQKKLCDVKCAEVVTTTYYPPITVKAGLCFQYEIEIKSKTTCETSYAKDAQPPKIEDKPVCNIKPICVSTGGHTAYQAGPNEEFEECIATKYKGKYTQKAINYCYNKVYKKSNKNKMSNSFDDVIPKKIAYTTDPWWCNPNDSKFTTANAKTIAENVYKYFSTGGYSGGEFVEKNGKVDWYSYNDHDPSDKTVKYIKGCYWNEYASFYFNNRNETFKTVYDDQFITGTYDNFNGKGTAMHNNVVVNGTNSTLAQLRSSVGSHPVATDDYDTIYYSPSFNKLNGTNDGNFYQKVYITVNGIKWAHYNRNGVYTLCNDSCSYTGKNNNCVLNPSTENGTSDDAEYNETEYTNKKAQCSAETKCKEDTVTYTFNVERGDKKNSDNINVTVCGYNKDNKNKNSNNCIQWDQQNSKKISVFDFKPSKVNEPIVKEVKGTCAWKKQTENYDYWDKITFYGTTTEKGVYHFGTKKEGVKYGFEPKRFCIPTTTPAINKNWSDWDLGIGYSTPREPEISKIKINYEKATDGTGTQYYRYKGVYNIFAKILKFGTYGWNIDYSCFYAVDPISGDNNCPEGKCKDSSDVANSKTRTVTLDNLFPSSGKMSNTTEEVTAKKLSGTDSEITATKVENTTVIDEKRRETGYNWSEAAQDLSRDYYKIDPQTLREKIEIVGDNVYNDAKELDYQIVLTTNNIKNIKNYNKKHDFANFPGIKHDSNDEKTRDYDGRKVKYTKIGDIYFYRSSFIRDTQYVANSSGKINKIIPNKIGCNNFTDRTC